MWKKKYNCIFVDCTTFAQRSEQVDAEGLLEAMCLAAAMKTGNEVVSAVTKV